MMDAIRVANCLSQTLEVDFKIRRSAEEELKSMEGVPGYGRILMDLIVSNEIPQPVALAAAVALKNYIKENWNREKCAHEICNEDRADLRMKALNHMYNTPSIIQKQLSQVVCIMGKYDTYVEWPELMPALAANLAESDQDRLIATLTTLDVLCRHYRFEMKSEKLWRELLHVLQNVASPLTTLFTQMVACIGSKDSLIAEQCKVWLNITTLCVKCFHSLSSQDLPEYFEDHLAPWMNGFMEFLLLNVPQLEAESDDIEANVIDKLKCCICEAVTLYSQRYEEETMFVLAPSSKQPAGESQPKHWLIETVWKLLLSVDRRARYDTLVNAALGFLSAVCQRPQYAAIFQPDDVLKTMCNDIIINNLILRKCDIEQFEDDPVEYMKRDIEGSDIGTRRRGASDFLRALCRQFEAQIMQLLSGTVQTFLEECGRDFQGNWLKKDVVYCVVTAMAVKAETAKYGATSTSDLINVVDFYQSQCRSDLFDIGVDDLPILKADALKYLVVFRNHLLPNQILEAFSALLKLLSSKHIIIHQYVAYAIERLLLVKIKETGKPLITNENLQVGPLIVALFACFDASPKAQNTPYVMKALMRCFNIIDPETAKSSGQIVAKLAAMIDMALKNPVDPFHLHYVFESLCVLIRQVYTVVEGGIDKYVVPLIETILSCDAVDVTPYALQVTALLLDQAQDMKVKTGNSCVDSYLPFFDNIMKEEVWLKTSNIPAALLVVESFLHSHSKQILEKHGNSLLAVLQRLLGSKALDQHGFKLAVALLPFANQTEAITEGSILIPMLRRVQFSKTTKFIKNLVFFFARFAIVRGAISFYQALEALQAGMFLMVVDKVIVAELKTMHNTTTYEEKRLCCIGFSNLLAETVDKLGAQYGALVEALVNLVEASGAGPTSVSQDDADENGIFPGMELERNDPYCKLSYAQHPDVIAADIVNFKAYLANAVMVRALAVKADSGNCITESIKNILVSYAQN